MMANTGMTAMGLLSCDAMCHFVAAEKHPDPMLADQPAFVVWEVQDRHRDFAPELQRGLRPSISTQSMTSRYSPLRWTKVQGVLRGCPEANTALQKLPL